MYCNTNSSAAAIDLNKEYSPSKNSKRFLTAAEPEKAVLDEFLKNITAQTQKALAKYEVRANITYKKNFKTAEDVSDNQFVDIYYKGKEENDSPIFVYIHGGYWQDLDRTTAGSFVEPLVERGYRVVVVDYNLCPGVTLQTLNEQIIDFYEWLFEYARQTKASQISICGHSAGAHLATLFFHNNNLPHLPYADRVVSFFLISGIYDLRECWQLSNVNPKNIFGLTNVTSVVALSPICCEFAKEFIELAHERNVRIHVLVGEHDSETFRGQSLAYANKLQKAGVQTACEVFEDYDHFDIIENVPVADSLINQYLLANL